jgi:hypothetical protein
MTAEDAAGLLAASGGGGVAPEVKHGRVVFAFPNDVDAATVVRSALSSLRTLSPDATGGGWEFRPDKTVDTSPPV